jgi:outer membrane biosynthesis protein TonB
MSIKRSREPGIRQIPLLGLLLFAVSAALPASPQNVPPTPLFAPADSAPSPPQEPVHISAGPMSTLLVSRFNPVLPEGSRATGIALLRVTISRSGKVEDAQMLSGPQDLTPNLLAAVRQWTWEPYLLNGSPVEVVTTLLMPYSPGDNPYPPTDPLAALTNQQLFDRAAGESKSGDWDMALYSFQVLLDRYPQIHDKKRILEVPANIRTLLGMAYFRELSLQAELNYYASTGIRLKPIGGGVSAPQVTSQAQPDFSSIAGIKSFSTPILVNLIVDEKGLPQNVQVLRGQGMIPDQRAVDAVKKYRFKPAMDDGKPVPVMLNVEINYAGY